MKRRKKSKLALSLLAEELKKVEEKDLHEILGGNGAVTSGTGTSEDPYVISSNYYYYGLDSQLTNNLNSAYRSSVVREQYSKVESILDLK